MAEENKYMDDAFKKMNDKINSDQYRVPYDSSFWNEAKNKLDDDQLDSAFKNAAVQASFVPDFSDNASDSIDDMFMDAAFTEAATEQQVTYDASYFNEFLEKEGDLLMDEAFMDAASAFSVDYQSEYWEDADKALQDEGLHYEYKTEYWKEAKRLLDKSDRRVFFMKWSAAAVLLLLISFGGPKLNSYVNPTELQQSDIVKKQDNTQHEEVNINNSDVRSTNNESIDADLAHFENNNSINKDSENNFEVEEINTINETTEHSSIEEHKDISNYNPSNNSILNENVDDFAENTNTNDIDPILNNHSENNDLNAITHSNNKEEFGFELPLLGEQKINLRSTNAAKRADFTSQSKIVSPNVKSIPMGMPDIELSQPKPQTAHEFAVLVEVGLGTKYGTFDYLPTLRSSAGVEYTVASGKHLPNWQFGGSFMVHHIKQSKFGYEDRRTVYSLNGSESINYWTKLQYEHLLYGNLNITAKYLISPKHKIGFNLGVEKLMAVRSNMSYMNNNLNEISTINDNWGIKEGVNQFDIRLGLNYEVQLNNALSLRFNSHFGLLDRTDDTFFGNDQKDHEIGITAGLKYNFLRLMK